MSEMIEVKTEALTDAALDYAVMFASWGDGPDWVVTDGVLNVVTLRNVRVGMDGIGEQEFHSAFSPSTRWQDCGPMIQQLKIDIETDRTYSVQDGLWYADIDGVFMSGETPLIAACRAIVASKLGDTVQIPKELL